MATAPWTALSSSVTGAGQSLRSREAQQFFPSFFFFRIFRLQENSFPLFARPGGSIGSPGDEECPYSMTARVGYRDTRPRRGEQSSVSELKSAHCSDSRVALS